MVLSLQGKFLPLGWRVPAELPQRLGMRQTKLLQMEISQEGRKEITSFWGITRHHPPTTLFAAVISLNNSWKQLLGVCIYTSAPLLTLGNGLMQSQFPKSFIPSRGKTSGLAAPLPDPAQPFNHKQDFGKCRTLARLDL